MHGKLLGVQGSLEGGGGWAMLIVELEASVGLALLSTPELMKFPL